MGRSTMIALFAAVALLGAALYMMYQDGSPSGSGCTTKTTLTGTYQSGVTPHASLAAGTQCAQLTAAQAKAKAVTKEQISAAWVQSGVKITDASLEVLGIIRTDGGDASKSVTGTAVFGTVINGKLQTENYYTKDFMGAGTPGGEGKDTGFCLSTSPGCGWNSQSIYATAAGNAMVKAQAAKSKSK